MRLLVLILCMMLVSGCATAPKTAPSQAPGQSLFPGNILTVPFLPVRGLFGWPIRGHISAPYGAKIDRVVNKGIDIRAEEGTIVRAARAGRVVYSDLRQRGFGKTVILDHGDGYQTVYAFNSEILVKVGDILAQNDAIARTGRTGRAKEPSLHFEIRKEGVPLNPMPFLSH